MKDQSKFAKKSLGQNFLTSTTVRENILKEAGDLRGKKVLEIGPGLGFLTQELIAAGAQLTAVELDNRAIKILNTKFQNKANFKLINGDILQQNLDRIFKDDDYCVIANIPYNITNPIIRKLLEKTKNKPRFVLLMVQKEVAHKICDPQIKNKTAGKPSLLNLEKPKALASQPEFNHLDPGKKILSIPRQGQALSLQPNAINRSCKRSILSISVEVYAHARYCFTVKREHFEPAPKVDSAIIRLDTLDKPIISPQETRTFFTVVNAGFSEKRKKIGNVLGKFFGLPANQLLGQIDTNRRAETLSVSEWIEIAQNFKTTVD